MNDNILFGLSDVQYDNATFMIILQVIYALRLRHSAVRNNMKWVGKVCLFIKSYEYEYDDVIHTHLNSFVGITFSDHTKPSESKYNNLTKTSFNLFVKFQFPVFQIRSCHSLNKPFKCHTEVWFDRVIHLHSIIEKYIFK